MPAVEEVFRLANAIHVEWTRVASEAYRHAHPEAGVCRWRDGDAAAIFAGDSNPLNQCYGIGIGDGDPETRLDQVVSFFAGRTKKWELILTPFEPAEVWNQAVDRGLRLDHFETLFFRALANLAPAKSLPHPMSVERVGPERKVEWGELSIRAFCGEDRPPFADDLMQILMHAENSRRFIGSWDGTPVAAASYSAYEGAAFLGGMGTLEPYRGRGFQQALLEARIRSAADEGAETALVEALPRSSSHRNIERLGFRVAYTSAVLVYESQSKT